MFYCHECAIEFAEKEGYNLHLQSAHSPTKRKCKKKTKLRMVKIALKSSPKKKQFENIINTKQEGKIQKRHQCLVCQKFVINLRKHVKNQHESTTSYSCGYCDRVFNRQGNVQKHIESVHERKKDHQCKYCGNSFSLKSNLNNHIKLVHRGVKNYPCVQCDKSFGMKSTLVNHIERVHEKKYTSYTCSICNFGFTHKKSLENHMINTHGRGEKPYSCELCNKKFMLNNKMKEHFNSIHDGKNQPFPCQKCVVGFTKNSDLQRHISSVHEGKRKEFVCSLCYAEFSRKDNYTIHIATVHEGQKPFKCSECDSSFPRKGELTKHIMFCHQGEWIQCPMCDSKFSDSFTIDRKIALKSHLLEVHDTECTESTIASMFLETQLLKENINQNQQEVYIQDVHTVVENEETVQEVSEKEQVHYPMVKIQETEEDVQLNPNPMENSGETGTNQVKLELTKDIEKIKMVKPVVSGVAISEQLSIYHPNIKIETVKKEPVFCSCSAEKDEKEEVIVHCKECKEDICQICYEAHLRLKMTKHHNFIWLNGNTEFVYKHQGSNKGIRIKVKSRNPQQDEIKFGKKIMKQRGLSFKPREEFLCKICGMSFTQKSSLKKHIATIHENKRYPCSDCDKIFTQSSGLHRHVRLFHKGEKEDIRKGSTCSKCKTYFKSELKLKQHISCAHPDSLGKTQYECNQCPAKFKQQSVLEKHITNVHEKVKSKFKCDICGVCVQSKENLKLHVGAVHEGKKYGCTFCDKEYTQRQHLRHHTSQVHGGKITYRCTICSQGFTTQQSRKKHMGRVHEEKKLPDENQCAFCGASFVQQEKLAKHIVQVHEWKNQPYSCSVCEFGFDDEKGLITHCANLHDKKGLKKPFVCIMCNIDCRNEKCLNLHNGKVHEGKKLQCCPFCNASFVRKSDLVKHKKMNHPVEFEVHEPKTENSVTTNKYKNHTCPDCNENFKLKEKYIEHLKLVHDKGAFICQYCYQDFTCHSGLYRHTQSVHEGLKYSCDYCEKIYTQKSHINRHMKNTHGKILQELKLSVEIMEKELEKETDDVKVSIVA